MIPPSSASIPLADPPKLEVVPDVDIVADEISALDPVPSTKIPEAPSPIVVMVTGPLERAVPPFITQTPRPGGPSKLVLITVSAGIETVVPFTGIV